MRPTLDRITFREITEVDNARLTTIFTREEIKCAVLSPDGYNFNLLKKFWNVVGDDFCNMVEDFHSNDRIVKGGNASFLVLVPKKYNPGGLNDYRSISLVGCMYKVLSKLLAERLSR